MAFATWNHAFTCLKAFLFGNNHKSKFWDFLMRKCPKFLSFCQLLAFHWPGFLQVQEFPRKHDPNIGNSSHWVAKGGWGKLSSEFLFFLQRLKVMPFLVKDDDIKNQAEQKAMFVTISHNLFWPGHHKCLQWVNPHKHHSMSWHFGHKPCRVNVTCPSHVFGCTGT